jgi:hypothetical protein
VVVCSLRAHDESGWGAAQVRAAWAASGAEAHEFLLENLKGFAEFQKEALRVEPNMAFKRHEKMDEKWEKEAMQVLDELEPEALLKQVCASHSTGVAAPARGPFSLAASGTICIRAPRASGDVCDWGV